MPITDRVLVTGGAGFIGSNLADELIRQGAKVRIIDNFATGNRSNLEEISGDFEHGSPKLSIGVAYSFLQTDANSPYARQSLGRTLGALNDPGKVDYNVSNFTADLLFKAGGLSLMSAFHWRKASKLPATAMGIAKNGIGCLGRKDRPIALCRRR